MSLRNVRFSPNEGGAGEAGGAGPTGGGADISKLTSMVETLVEKVGGLETGLQQARVESGMARQQFNQLASMFDGAIAAGGAVEGDDAAAQAAAAAAQLTPEQQAAAQAPAPAAAPAQRVFQQGTPEQQAALIQQQAQRIEALEKFANEQIGATNLTHLQTEIKTALGALPKADQAYVDYHSVESELYRDPQADIAATAAAIVSRRRKGHSEAGMAMVPQKVMEAIQGGGPPQQPEIRFKDTEEASNYLRVKRENVKRVELGMEPVEFQLESQKPAAAAAGNSAAAPTT